MLGAESDDELLVGLLLAGLVEDAHVGLSSVEGLGSLTETAGKTVVHEGELEDALERIEDRHLALGSLSGNLDLLSGNGGLFYVRLERTKNSPLAHISSCTGSCPVPVRLDLVRARGGCLVFQVPENRRCIGVVATGREGAHHLD